MDTLVAMRGCALGRISLGRARMVPRAGLEPAHLAAAHFKCDVSTNFTIGARCEASH